MSDAEVLVVGGGLGGVTAALVAAEHATVQLVAPRDHPFEAHAGLIDVLGYDSGDLVDRPLDVVEALPDDHPYRMVGAASLQQGLDTFDEVTSDTYAGAGCARNGLVPTAIGGVRPALRYPNAVTPGLLSRDTEMTLVGFDHLADFDPFHAAERLRALGVPFEVEAVQVTLPFDAHEGSPAHRIATALDADETVGRGVPIRQSVVRSIRAQLVEPDRVGFPAVLGIEAAETVRSELEADLDAPVFEVPLGPPSFPGRRLEATFESALTSAGVAVDRDNDVGAVEAEGNNIRRVDLTDGRTVTPEAVVLAPGGLADGGLLARRAGIDEPRFDCPISHPEDRRAWTGTGQLDDHPLAAIGVRIDSRARPRTTDGEPVYDNLTAAGRIVGGANLIAQHAVSGVALATGAKAGRTAVGRD